MKKQDLKKAYSKVPKDFHYSVVRSLNGLEEKQPAGAKSRVLRTAIVCAIVLSISALGVISAAAIYPMVVNRDGNYGMTIDIQPSDDSSGSVSLSKMSVELGANTKSASEYVKLNVGYLPDGVIADDESAIKYSLNGEHTEKCFSFLSLRVAQNQTFTDEFIADYETLEVNGNQAVIAHVSGATTEFTKRFYIYFEDEALFVKCYVSDDVSDEEINKVMENLSVSEGTEENNSGGALSDAKTSIAEKLSDAVAEFTNSFAEEESSYSFNVIDLGTPISYASELTEDSGEFDGNYTVDSIEVLDNISSLDSSCFDIGYDDLSDYADEYGNLLPHTRETWSYGDGISTTNEIIDSKTVNRKFVYITLTLNNTSDTTKTFYFPQVTLSRLTETNGELDFSNSDVLGYETEINYIDNNNVDAEGFQHGYNFLDVEPNSSETVHIGFFADEDVLDELYVTLDGSWFSGSVFDSEANMFVDNENFGTYYSYACMKIE